MLRKQLSRFFRVCVVVAGMIYIYFPTSQVVAQSHQEVKQNAASEKSIPFEVLDAAHRELDGSPALTLSFSLPVNTKRDVGRYIQVFEMSAGESDKTPQANQSSEEEDEWSGNTQKYSTGVSKESADTQVNGGKLVSGAWVVGKNPRLLFFPHIKPQTRYVVRIQPGLPAANGVTLPEEDRFSIKTAAVSPVYYFASRGMVLPAVQNGGLPVITVNVPEVDIQFLRVKDEQLPNFLEQVIAGATRGQRALNSQETDDGESSENIYNYYDKPNLRGATNIWSLDKIHGMTESAFTGRFMTEKKSNKRSVTFIPVENIAALSKPGVYIAVMSQPNRFRYDYQTSYFYISNLGLHIRQYAGESAEAFVSSLVTGKGEEGVEVSWVDANGKILAQAKTNAQGKASFPKRPKGAKLVLAKKDLQTSLITLKEPALDLAEFDVSGLTSSPIRLFAYSGRNLYRPGETFDVSVIARDSDGRMLSTQPIHAILRRPDGKTQWTTSWQPDKQFAGYYRQTIELPADSPTGTWSLELRSDPASHIANTVMRLNVEEFLPERMKLDLGSASQVLNAGEENWRIDITGNYLYGAPAAGNKLLGVVNTERKANPLEKTLPGFFFGDMNEDTVHSRTELSAQSLDMDGKGSVSVSLSPVLKRRSPFTVRTTLSLLESGGRPVIRSIERIFWPAAELVAVRPMFNSAYARENSNVEFEVIRTNSSGELLAATELPVRIFRENRHYYWRFDDQRGWHSGFSETDELVSTSLISLKAGEREKLMFPVNYGRYRVEIIDPETGMSMRYRFYAGWFAKDDETQGVRPDRVGMKFDKPNYREGETAKLTITPPHAGEALITVEGDKLLWSWRQAVPAKESTINIPIKEEWKRHDLYVNVMVLRPGNTGQRYDRTTGATPARAMGLIYLPLDREDRKLDVTLDAPKKIKPSEKLKVKIKAPQAKHQNTLVTLSAVDAGILNITSFRSPDPFAFFFGKLRYGHDLYDIYGRLIEKMAGRKGKLKWGGDAAPKPTQSLPKKVRLVDLFSGPVALDANGEANIELDVPDFNGSLRLMAVVSGKEHFGMQEAEVTVVSPLVVELATPRFLSVGDQANLALDIHNLAGTDQAVSVKINNDAGLKIQNNEQTVMLKDGEKRLVRIPLESGTALGLTEVKVTVESTLMKIDRSFPLQVQAPTPRQSITKRYNVPPGETLSIQEAHLSGFLPSSVNGTLIVSDKAPIDVRNVVQGLLTYPYGCAEQVTSSAYPHVFINEDEARRFGLKPFTLAQRADMLQKTIFKLASMQAPNGGFSLWGNVSEYQYWLSAYIANFMLDAREQGFSVPADVERKAVDFLLRGLQEGVASLPKGALSYNENSIWNDMRYAGSGRFGVLAYGAYVLAKHDKAPLSTLRQMHESMGQSYSGLSLIHLGIALKLAGDETRAQDAIASGLTKVRKSNQWWGDYGSNLRDWSLMYVLLERYKLKPEGRENLISEVGNEIGSRNGYYYYSTQEKLALFLLGRNFAQTKGESWSAELAFLADNKPGITQPLATSGTLFKPLELEQIKEGFTLKNLGDKPLYLELSYSGNPETQPAERSDNFRIQRYWYSADGRALSNKTLKVGDSIIVRINVRPTGRFANALVVDYIPAGIEIENVNIGQGENASMVIGGIDMRSAMQDQRIKHREFRDDRFVVAARINSEMNFFYRARVVTPGRFVIPPAYAEDMYQPTIYGLAGGNDFVTIENGDPAPTPATSEKATDGDRTPGARQAEAQKTRVK